MFSKRLPIVLCIIAIFSLCFTAVAENTAPLFEQIDNSSEQTETAGSAASGTLMEDGLFESLKDGEYRVFGSGIARSTVYRIRFVNSLEMISADAWDVSAGKDGSVMAEMSNGTLRIAANGNIKAPASCAYMFSLYRNLKSVTGTEYFDTSSVTDMTGMFSGCSSLRTIDLNAWDVSKVTSMASMFEGCSELTNVSASSWDMSSLTNSTGIFNECTQLGIETIDGLNTEKYDAMEAEAEQTYTPLARGSRGSAVKDLQKQLTKAGYNTGKADGIYGTQTATAVHAFKVDHNIYDGGKHNANECTASALMQAALFALETDSVGNGSTETEESSAPAEPVKESGITLTIPDKCEIEGEELSGNQLRITLLLSNTSSTHSIVAYTLAIYATSVWNTESNETPVYHTIIQTIAPGATERSGSLVIDTDGRIANLFIGVQSVTYEDGTAITADDISYKSLSTIGWAKDDD